MVMSLDGVRWTLPGCPTPPAWALDWAAVVDSYEWLRTLGNVPQDAVFHAEGDVLTHTRMVVEALVALPVWRSLAETERAVLFAAALLHDIGKPSCTLTDADGRISSRGHARLGAAITRGLLWTSTGIRRAAPFAVREAVTALVRLHGLPLMFLDQSDIDRAIFAASYQLCLEHVALLSEADVRGRVCADQSELLARVDLFRETCQAYGCLTGPRAFPSAHSRVRYFRRRQQDADYHAFDDTWGEVVVLAGLPGTGKDTWCHTQMPDRPVISLDAIRTAQRIAPEDSQGAVAAAAKELARSFLRRRQPFIWNATNLTRQQRDPLLDLVLGYGARVRIIYLDAPIAEILQRNRSRRAMVPERVIHRLAGKLDLPDLTEAHRVEYVVE